MAGAQVQEELEAVGTGCSSCGCSCSCNCRRRRRRRSIPVLVLALALALVVWKTQRRRERLRPLRNKIIHIPNLIPSQWERPESGTISQRPDLRPDAAIRNHGLKIGDLVVRLREGRVDVVVLDGKGETRPEPPATIEGVDAPEQPDGELTVIGVLE